MRHKFKNITPLMELYIKDEDTQEMIDKALQIAAEHPYYLADKSPASMTTFLTEQDRKDNKTNYPAIRVEHGTIYEVQRFKAALNEVRNEGRSVPSNY